MGEERVFCKSKGKPYFELRKGLRVWGLTKAAGRPVLRIVIYYVQSKDKGLIKIGWTQQPSRRMRSLECRFGPLVFLGMHCGDRHTERRIHEAFKADHVGHEWFRPTDQLLWQIKLTNTAAPSAHFMLYPKSALAS